MPVQARAARTHAVQEEILTLPPPLPSPRRGSANTTADAVPSWLIVALSLGVMGYGTYQVYLTNREKRALKLEKWMIRTSLVPLLQSEEDVAFLERKERRLAEEARIMKDVPGWVVGESVYHSKRFVLPPLNDQNFPGRWGEEKV